MNNKGQTLAVFVILLPFIFVLVGYFVEKLDLLYQEKSQKELASTLCQYALNRENSQIQVEQLALENDSQIKKVEIFYQQKEVQITLTKERKSILSKIIGKDSYLIKTTVNCVE